MIASVSFRNFKALRSANLELAPFNLVIGPSGSGKSSLLEAVLRLQTLARLPVRSPESTKSEAAEIIFRFAPPFDGVRARLACVSAFVCDLLEVIPAASPQWPALQAKIARFRAYLLDHRAMAAPALVSEGIELSQNGDNVAAVLAHLQRRAPVEFASLQREFVRLLPEFGGIEFSPVGDRVELALRLDERQGGGRVLAADLAQGTLFILAMFAIAFDPDPPAVVCFEEIDRGIHPRMLREVRDLFYRLSYPEAAGLRRQPTQVLATTHSPFMVDLFRDHPEEVVISQKRGTEAHFERLADRADLAELLRDGSLGDIWMSGILGGVPEERQPEDDAEDLGPNGEATNAKPS